MVITIDGPVASGKTSISRAVAERLGYKVLQTSLLYRAVAYVIIQYSDLSADDTSVEVEEHIRHFCDALTPEGCVVFDEIEYGYRGESLFPYVLIDGEDMTLQIQNHFFDMPASLASSFKVIRDYLLDVQRDVGKKHNIVAEGRDCGTVVFPQAEHKFYLDASVAVRAQRYLNDGKRHSAASLDEIIREIRRRDEQDMTRPLAPLCKAEGACVIDSSAIMTDEVIDLICKKV